MNTEIEKIIQKTAEWKGVKKWTRMHKELVKVAKKMSRKRASERDIIISQLSEKVISLEHKMSEEPTDKTWNLLSKTTTDLDEMQFEKTKGVMFRTKARWHELGERNTKFFYNLEKTRYNSKVCSKLIDDNGVLITRMDEVMELQEKYYTDLYKKDSSIVFQVNNNTGIPVPEETKTSMNMPFTLQELGNAMKQLKSGKTPGISGLTAEYYKMFCSRR